MGVGKLPFYWLSFIAQNDSFVQKGVGVKYKTMQKWSFFQRLAIPLIKPISAYYYDNKLYGFLIKNSYIRFWSINILLYSWLDFFSLL